MCQESEWTQQGPCGQQGNNLWATKRRERVLWIQHSGRITWSGRKRHSGRSKACTSAPHEERKEFQRFATEGNEKADELANAGAMLDEEFMAEARAETVQQEREEIYAALQYAASFHCLVEEWKDCEELKPKPK